MSEARRFQELRVVLGLTPGTVGSNARVTLSDALIDIEHNGGHADAACIRTIKRVIEQLKTVERLLGRSHTHD